MHLHLLFLSTYEIAEYVTTGFILVDLVNKILDFIDLIFRKYALLPVNMPPILVYLGATGMRMCS